MLWFPILNHSNTTFKLGHFFVTELLKDKIITCSSIDNHLYSDHVPIYLELNIDVVHELEKIRPYTVKQAWHKASDQDLNIYKNQLDSLLGKVTLDEDLLFCRDLHYVERRDMICDLYNTVTVYTKSYKSREPKWLP